MWVDAKTSSDIAPTNEGTVSLLVHWSQSYPSNEDESGTPSEAAEVLIAPKQVNKGHQLTLEVILTQFNYSKQETNTTTLFKHQLYGFVKPKAIWTICRESANSEVNQRRKHALHWPRLIHDVEVDKSSVMYRSRNMSVS
ncbi:hypothetical protein X801_08401 [Opisthorchis viverrini]|uniref:Uncharacterized protein n=1 Tax=Opisthorchis viverrini TaxID=6198 RepID=A0A1S8WN46_OPIVI|nr:hypothetical protein X801_08401 [Opisthorchis viverrini]